MCFETVLGFENITSNENYINKLKYVTIKYNIWSL